MGEKSYGGKISRAVAEAERGASSQVWGKYQGCFFILISVGGQRSQCAMFNVRSNPFNSMRSKLITPFSAPSVHFRHHARRELSVSNECFLTAYAFLAALAALAAMTVHSVQT